MQDFLGFQSTLPDFHSLHIDDGMRLWFDDVKTFDNKVKSWVKH